MDPRGLAELVPDFAKTAPLDTPVTDDAAYFLTDSNAWKLPITPPPLRNHGNYVVSLNKLVKWLGGLVEQAGVNVFTQFAGAQLIYEGDGIAGVITEDKGLDKDGKPKDNFTPGYELRAKVTVLAEGPRGSLTKGPGGAEEARRPESAGLQHRRQGVVGRARRAHRSRAGWRTRSAGRSIPACTAAAGSTACATTASRWVWSPDSNTTIRASTRMKPFSASRRTLLCGGFSKAASSCATARRPCPSAAGIRCRAPTWMAG